MTSDSGDRAFEHKVTMYQTSIYDVSFKHPLPKLGLETSRVKLTPFLPLVHGPKQTFERSDLEKFIPIPLDPASIEKFFRTDPESIPFAVSDETKGEQRVIGPAPVDGAISPPELQRTFVNINALEILMRYCLDSPKGGGRSERARLHSILLSACWDEWENGEMANVEKTLERTSWNPEHI